MNSLLSQAFMKQAAHNRVEAAWSNRNREASDWGQDGKRLFEIDPKEIQLYHIFPFNFMVNDKAALKTYTDNDWSAADLRTDVNDIANLTFISQAENTDISDKPPWEYLPRKTTRESRKAHFIPEDSELWRPDRFHDFVEERRRLLSKAMTSFLKKLR